MAAVNADERAFCVCGGEVALVRLTPSILRLGHRSNPKNAHHYVRLSRSAENVLRHPGAGPSGLRSPRSEAADTLRAAANAVASHPLTTRRQAGQSEGSTRSRVSPSGISSPAGRASQSGVAPRPRLRPARSAGSETAGEGV